jgi:hypothetical protein
MAHFIMLPVDVVGETLLGYVQRYVGLHVHSTSEFQVCGGQQQISSFEREGINLLCLMLSTLSQYSYDGKYNICSMFYYLDILLQMPRLIRWVDVFFRHFCCALDHYHLLFYGTQ